MKKIRQTYSACVREGKEPRTRFELQRFVLTHFLLPGNTISALAKGSRLADFAI